MVEGRFKSRSMRKVKVKTPGGRVATHYKPRKPKAHKCGKCGKPLKGTPRERPVKLRNMPKTYKRPERPYAGVLCSKCARVKIKLEARKQG